MSPVALHYLNVLIFLLLSPSILAEPPKEWVSQLKEEVTNNLDKINRYQKEVNNSKDTLKQRLEVTNEANNIMNEYGITEEIRALPWQTYLGIYNIIYRVKKAKCKQKNCERLTENKQNDLNVVQHFQQEAIKSQVRLNSCILINDVLTDITGTLKHNN
ncbi:hypothetical protein EWB00_001969 [Schistosoma japonicum]|uniref:Egg protein n=1 Tax=Schistosoma japonicum TaxID=6182 RepID=A0A4Z2DED6_SCHJA|nr:hypothetical protein EWB00_001969 [Schistosoma japonicum]